MDIPNFPEQFQGLAAFSMEKIPPDVHPDPPPAAIPRPFSLLLLFPTSFQGILEWKRSPPRGASRMSRSSREFPNPGVDKSCSDLSRERQGFPPLSMDIPRISPGTGLRQRSGMEPQLRETGKPMGGASQKSTEFRPGTSPGAAQTLPKNIPSPVPFSREFPARLHWE